jgi:nickel-dependent lactate racemase
MIGKGSETQILSEAEVRAISTEFIEREGLRGKRVLGIIPDHTRSAPIDLMFRTMYSLLAPQRGQFDMLIALGTHPPMSAEAIDKRLGLVAGDRQNRYPNTQIFNHSWKDPASLQTIGTISADEVNVLSRGMMHEAVHVSINRLVLSYDVILIIGPTFPHEVVGFSGGNKYLFPGISGQEIIDMFHWLGALITNPVIIGRKDTPVRRVVDTAAAMLSIPRLCMSLVVRETGLAGLFCGSPEEAWSAAADLSDRVHITYKDHPFDRVLSCAPTMYDELWVGGKAMYKLEPVVADGGELIIFAPHIKEISVTHGAYIEQVGYHVRDYFLRQMERFGDVPKGVLAHSTHVKGIGTYANGKEQPRISVVLATGIPAETCRKINLGYRDPNTINPEEWMGKEGSGILHVPKAGEMLYRLRKDPFRLS